MGLGFGKNKYDFSSLLKGLQQAVSSAQELLEVQQLNALNKFLDSEGNVLTKQITTCSGSHLDIPILSLVPQNALTMDSVEIEFDAKMESVSNTQLVNSELGAEVNNAQVQLGLVGKKDDGVVHVKVVFKSTKTPEGLNKLIDECNKYA